MSNKSKKRESFLGEILVAENVISQRDLEWALQEQQKQKGKHLGEILIGMGVPQTKINVTLDRFDRRKAFGQVLLDLKLLPPEQLNKVLARQAKLRERGNRLPLGLIALEMGLLKFDDYLTALSKHFNMPICSLEKFTPKFRLQEVIGLNYAQEYKIIVMEEHDTYIKLALAEPSKSLIEELQKYFPTKTVEMYLAHPGQVNTCLKMVSDPFAVTLYR